MDLPCGDTRRLNEAVDMKARTAILAAGGTGGHLFPAQALAGELQQRGWQIHIATDVRAKRYIGNFAYGEIHVIESANPSSRNPIEITRAALKLVRGYLQARRLLRALNPDLVVGFGGYPTLPPLLAAQHLRVANMIHEQNTVMGRANRLLARRANAVAIGFQGGGSGAVVTGNPVRAAVIDAASKPYPARKETDPFRFLIFGGSQGAQYFGEVVPAALAQLDGDLLQRVRIVHQIRQEQLETVSKQYDALSIETDTAPFFDDMPAKIADAHLVLARAGASTVTELAVIGRPSLLVPYPYALDHDQAKNAASLAAAGGAMIEKQADLDVGRLTQILKNAILDPQRLAIMAEKAKREAKPDAVTRLADLAETVANRSSVDPSNEKGSI